MAVGFIQSYALGKRFAEHANYVIDADQELIALGLAKIGGSFFQAIDTPGSFSRTAINYEAGAKSQISHVFTALIILIFLYFATTLLFYLPNSSLSAIVIVAVIQLLVSLLLLITA
jgi:SulP family sulfate permease